MHEYLGRIQLLWDSLKSSDHSIYDTILISTILDGLTAEYEHIVVVLTASRQPYYVAGVASILLDAKARQQDNLIQISPTSVALNVQTESGSNSAGVSSTCQYVQYTPLQPVQF